jgi:hypothetical protein
MTRFHAALLVALAPVVACSDPAATSLGPLAHQTASVAANPATKYKLRFVSGVNPAGDGEIESPWFPDAGLTLNTKTPWKNLSASGATLTLVNSTHGDWSAPTCDTFLHRAYPVSITTWDVAGTSPVLSYAGSWYGTFSIGQSNGTNVGFDGDRLVGGVVTPSAGGIHNVVTYSIAAVETRDPSGNNDWFRIELRNAGMQFGSASSPDGVTNPIGAEVSCANFTIEARKTSLITP